jgi:hypothetical protein
MVEGKGDLTGSSNERRILMPSWLLILIVGVVLMIIGFSGVGSLLVWIGVAVLVVSLILGLVGRGRSRA